MIYDQKNCTLFKYEETKGEFNTPMFIAVIITWILTSLGLIMGPKSLGFINVVTAVLPFILLPILMIKFIMLNNEVEGDGISYFIGGKSIVLQNNELYDPSENVEDIIEDAYNQVIYSLGLGFGIMFAFGSYNEIKKPVIRDAMIICITDFIFSILAGFIAWGAIGYLLKKNDPAAL